MADIVFRYEEMAKAVNEIKDIAARYKAAAITLESDFNAATRAWEGESGDAMRQMIAGPVMEYTRDTIPQLLEALAGLLESNATQMKTADHQIAENIPTKLN